jgi:predicted PurR-regulated permease PerM
LVEASTNTDQQIKQQLTRVFQPSKISYFFSSFISIASSAAIAVFSILFIAFFFLQEQGLFIQFLQNFVPSRFEDKVQKTVDEVSNLLTRYFGGILLQIAIISTYLLILLSIVGVKNALLIAVFAALINVIPYLGPLIGGAFGIMLTITSSLDLDFYSEMMPLLIKVLLCFMSVQMIDNLILQPFIFSNRVRAHPLEIFIIIMIGAKIGGIVGMVLAIPAYTVIRVIARTFLSEFEIIQKIAIGLKQPVPEKGKNPDKPHDPVKPPFTEV